MIICITGFGWSGSGAVFDLIREYSDVKVVDNNGRDFEFCILSDVDGILDLEFHTNVKHCRISSFQAIRRFKKLCYSYCIHLGYETIFKNKFMALSSDYINQLVDFELEGTTFTDYFEMPKGQVLYNRILGKLLCNRYTVKYGLSLYNSIRVWPRSKMQVSYQPKHFIEITKKYIKDLLDIATSNEQKPLVVDQIFPPDCPELFFKYVDDPRCIVVRRDPRDTYLLAKCAYKSKIALPVSDVESFICFYKKIVESTINNDNKFILNIQYEDLIYRYEDTKEKVENFLGLKSHIIPKQKFDPNVSINNTQLFNKYKGYEDDIREIERQLPDSLYPFDRYQRVDHTDDKKESW